MGRFWEPSSQTKFPSQGPALQSGLSRDSGLGPAVSPPFCTNGQPFPRKHCCSYMPARPALPGRGVYWEGGGPGRDSGYWRPRRNHRGFPVFWLSLSTPQLNPTPQKNTPMFSIRPGSLPQTTRLLSPYLLLLWWRWAYIFSLIFTPFMDTPLFPLIFLVSWLPVTLLMPVVSELMWTGKNCCEKIC